MAPRAAAPAEPKPVDAPADPVAVVTPPADPAVADATPDDPPAGEPHAGDVAEVAGGVELVVTADIGGTIDGVNVPRPGGRITLPAHEAETWLRFGYGVPVED